ncbi:hypothetical protein [Pseudomonas psychrophila]|uniref:hypothetical protein n=1 Tax=Pseudomonas psychrophila TaxID=122355 RepID=UPI00035E2C4D|nr:hypothetical protein [Pseudomonas psychrophila]
MIKNKIHVNNPLTVIAIFSMLTEASAAVSLPYIDKENQKIYVWFLIVFPSILITLFFLTLNFNNKTLYSPADYAKEKSREASPTRTNSTHAKPALPTKKSDIPTEQYSIQPAKLNFKCMSYPPQNFIFLPQGHRDYDSSFKTPNKAPPTALFELSHLLLKKSELSSLRLIDLSHPALQLKHDQTLSDILQTYYDIAHPQKSKLRKSDVLLLLTNSPSAISTQCRQQQFYLDSTLASHLNEATIITYNTETRQLNTLSTHSL